MESSSTDTEHLWGYPASIKSVASQTTGPHMVHLGAESWILSDGNRHCIGKLL